MAAPCPPSVGPSPWFFTVNGGQVNCACIEYQAEAARMVGEITGIPESRLLVILGMDRLARCGPTSPTSPQALTTFGDLEVMEYKGDTLAVVPVDKVESHVRYGAYYEVPKASNFTYRQQFSEGKPYYDEFEPEGVFGPTKTRYTVLADIAAQVPRESLEECAVLVPREHLKLFA